MTVQSEARHEAMAQALADNVPLMEAYRGAGYTGSDPARIARLPTMKARVKHLIAAAAASGSPDLAPVIAELMQLARKAADIGSPAGLTAARDLLSEAARLKLLWAADIRDREQDARQIRAPMSRDTWMATYAAKD